MVHSPGGGGVVSGRKATVLEEAANIVSGARNADYGDPRVNHARTAALWSAYLGVTITPRQVCVLNILQKASRDAHRAKRDNLVDIAGWARNAELVEDPRERDLRVREFPNEVDRG